MTITLDGKICCSVSKTQRETNLSLFKFNVKQYFTIQWIKQKKNASIDTINNPTIILVATECKCQLSGMNATTLSLQHWLFPKHVLRKVLQPQYLGFDHAHITAVTGTFLDVWCVTWSDPVNCKTNASTNTWKVQGIN